MESLNKPVAFQLFKKQCNLLSMKQYTDPQHKGRMRADGPGSRRTAWSPAHGAAPAAVPFLQAPNPCLCL